MTDNKDAIKRSVENLKNSDEYLPALKLQILLLNQYLS
jgi:hypothetical protein